MFQTFILRRKGTDEILYKFRELFLAYSHLSDHKPILSPSLKTLLTRDKVIVTPK